MITGAVHSREARIPLEVAGLNQVPQPIEAVIDTGFNGSLTLPETLIREMDLPFAGHRRGMLADGTIARLSLYLATVTWHGTQREILVSETAGAPLVGMSLLEGDRLVIDAVEGGDVRVEPRS